MLQYKPDTIPEKPRLKAYGLNNLHEIKQLSYLSEEEIFAIKTVGAVLPFKTNNYVANQLINWDDYQNDPIFLLNFPQKQMLSEEHFAIMADLIKNEAPREKIQRTANEIRMQLNPHPAGQLEHNVAQLNGKPLPGIQHKYHETLLFFPGQGQTCHAYCTYCFRWPQFVGIKELKFAMKETALLIEYLQEHPEVTDVLFTGGEPLIMKADTLAAYIRPLLAADLPNLTTIRIGSKALGYWPYRFTSDDDSEQLLDLFREVTTAGKQLAFMSHFTHINEMQPPVLREAVGRIQETGAIIRSQAPLLKRINDQPVVWSSMWKKQAELGIIPYYMFLPRDTGAQHYFSVPLEEAWKIFREAFSKVSGICRTVRGPSMSTNYGKVHVLGVEKVKGEKVFNLVLIQGRQEDWVLRPFFAEFNPDATWLSDLKPAFGEEKFFFED